VAGPASKSLRERWLTELTDLPTASGRESAVQTWVRGWAVKRGLDVTEDRAGNLLLRPRTRNRRRPIVAVAHMDHPALVVRRTGRRTEVELRGGVLPDYLIGARLQLETSGGPKPVALQEFDPDTSRGWLAGEDLGADAGDIIRWAFPSGSLGIQGPRLQARACDDLAGAAAALATLDRLALAGVANFWVLLTRAEEVGFVGAIAACELGTLPAAARIFSIECSRQSSEAPLGGGPILRVGDASRIFSSELTNRVAEIVRGEDIPHQRKLMVGGSCEATAFVALGYEATGMCVALDNYHNMVDIDGVRAGKRRARLGPEAIALADFHGLVDVLAVVGQRLDSGKSNLPTRLKRMYRTERSVLGQV